MYYVILNDANCSIGFTNTQPQVEENYREVDDSLVGQNLILDSDILRPMTEEEFDNFIKSTTINSVSVSVRNRREILLEKSDWTQSPDSPLTDSKKNEWKIYRENLRNIPQQSGFPFDVQWPEQPN